MLTNKTLSSFINVLFFLIFLMLVNGRSFLGIYIYDFRIGELLTGFSLVLLIFIFSKFSYIKENFGSTTVNIYFLMIVFFVIRNFIEGVNSISFYTFRSSVSIWYIAYFFFGLFIFKNFKFKKFYFVIGYIGLALQYMFNVLYYPSFLEEFFNQYSDKTQFLKGSEIAIFFIIVTLFSNKFNKNSIYLYVFVILSSVYLPLMFFKSRSGGFALFIYVFLEIYKYRKYLTKNIKNSILVFFISLFLFSISTHYILGNPLEKFIEVEETPSAVAQVFKHKYVVANTYDEELPIIYVFENRLYSADGNLNWRLQLWQEVFESSENSFETMFGFGFSKPHPVFSQKIYSGLDGLNENAHNYFINLFIKGGVCFLVMTLLFFYFLFKNKINTQFFRLDLLEFVLPLLIISMFDGSMENPYFGILFYFFLSSFYAGIKFDWEGL